MKSSSTIPLEMDITDQMDRSAEAMLLIQTALQNHAVIRGHNYAQMATTTHPLLSPLQLAEFTIKPYGPEMEQDIQKFNLTNNQSFTSLLSAPFILNNWANLNPGKLFFLLMQESNKLILNELVLAACEKIKQIKYDNNAVARESAVCREDKEEAVAAVVSSPSSFISGAGTGASASITNAVNISLSSSSSTSASTDLIDFLRLLLQYTGGFSLFGASSSGGSSSSSSSQTSSSTDSQSSLQLLLTAVQPAYHHCMREDSLMHRIHTATSTSQSIPQTPPLLFTEHMRSHLFADIAVCVLTLSRAMSVCSVKEVVSSTLPAYYSSLRSVVASYGMQASSCSLTSGGASPSNTTTSSTTTSSTTTSSTSSSSQSSSLATEIYFALQLQGIFLPPEPSKSYLFKNPQLRGWTQVSIGSSSTGRQPRGVEKRRQVRPMRIFHKS